MSLLNFVGFETGDLAEALLLAGTGSIVKFVVAEYRLRVVDHWRGGGGFSGQLGTG